jgi:hypothetical protein
MIAVGADLTLWRIACVPRRLDLETMASQSGVCGLFLVDVTPSTERTNREISRGTKARLACFAHSSSMLWNERSLTGGRTLDPTLVWHTRLY